MNRKRLQSHLTPKVLNRAKSPRQLYSRCDRNQKRRARRSDNAPEFGYERASKCESERQRRCVIIYLLSLRNLHHGLSILNTKVSMWKVCNISEMYRVSRLP
ncbi:hypothetical protein NFI96_010529 [Prochilodus magdalenae]|nr:hypothetical protein NFI96_010529 [Prochilodus magdalenae]